MTAAREAVLDGLVARGILRRVEGRVLWVFANRRFPKVPGRAETVEARVQDLTRGINEFLVPFFLAPIAGDRPRWFQDDGIHPRTEAQPLMLDAVWPQLEVLLKQLAASSGKAKP